MNCLAFAILLGGLALLVLTTDLNLLDNATVAARLSMFLFAAAEVLIGLTARIL